MIDEAKVWDLINASEARMSFAQRRMWEFVRTDPQLWHAEGRGPSWLVAVVGVYALVYNDIEEGFSRSEMVSPGKLSGVDGHGWELEELMQQFINITVDGYDSAPRVSGPFPGEYPGGS